MGRQGLRWGGGLRRGPSGAGKGVHLGTEDDLWRRPGTGAQGAISALANFVSEEVLEVYQAATENDETRGKALSEGLKEARAMTKQYASPAVLEKLAEAQHGVPMGTPCVPPSCPSRRTTTRRRR